MARARNVKPGFFQNEALGSIDPHARLLFIGLWTISDKEGRFEVRLEKINASLFPYEQVMLEPLLAQLWDKHFLTFYESQNRRFGQINNWRRHQTPHHKEHNSEIPPCEEEKTFTSQDDMYAWLKNGSSTAQSRFNEIASCPTDSGFRIPDSTSKKQSLDTPPKDQKFTDEDKALAEEIYSRVLSVAPKTKQPNIDRWADEIRLMRERDELSPKEIKKVFVWANQDSFWQTNILSPDKLRKQFARLDAEMKKNSNPDPTSGDNGGHWL